MLLNRLLTGDRNNNPALAAALTKLEEKGFHTGPVAALEDVLDPEMTELRKKLRDACGIVDETNLIDVLSGLKSLESVIGRFDLKAAIRLLIEAVQEAPGAALQDRDVLRRAAARTERARTPVLQRILTLLHYAGADEAALKTKKALIKSLDDHNIHKRNVPLIDYDAFAVPDVPAYVVALEEAGKKAGLSFTIEEAQALCDAVGKDTKRDGLDGCSANHLLKVLTVRLRAGKCNGRALESVDELAQACFDAGFNNSEIMKALKHLLDPLTGEDGLEPTKTKDKKRWNERQAAARRVADLLHAMGIHNKNVTFALYNAVREEWRAKMDKRKEKAEEAQFKEDMDGIDNAEDEEPKAKRPKRSCRTKTRRCGST